MTTLTQSNKSLSEKLLERWAEHDLEDCKAAMDRVLRRYKLKVAKEKAND